MKPNAKELLKIAEKARLCSYSPYSDFAVGAALLCSDGSIYEGCNIESASYTPTCCAERVAIFGAISEGKRDFEAIAVVGGKKGSDAQNFCYPCGVCRQVLSEFCASQMKIILTNGSDLLELTLGELLPYTFKLDTDGEK